MPYIPLTLPPGVVRKGSIYDSRGRWYDSNLIRWADGGVVQPWGGWAVLSGAGAAAVGSKPVRGLFAWRRAAGTAFVAIGTYDKLFVYSAGTLSDVTPSVSWTSGGANASGSFYARTEATSWQFDVRNEDMFAVSTADQELRMWDSSVGVGTVAATVTNSPACLACVVTPENFLVALAANDGTSINGRYIKWADQNDVTLWTAAATNQARDFTLTGSGQVMAGRKGRDETLIWTDTELHAMRYIGPPFVYSFTKLGANCGAISRRSMAVVDGQALWLGPRGFFRYDGFVRPIECEVGDFVFNRLNRAQASKICAVPNTDFKEVTWFYPSGSGTPENDSYVSYNYVTGAWSLGNLQRTDGIDRGFLEYPIMGDQDGSVYEHENGTAYTDEGGSPAYTPYVESGPVEIGDGDRVMHVRQYVPDEETLGEVNTRLYARFYPNAAETTYGPFTNANPTDTRLTARQVRIRHTQVTAGWRVGTPRLEAVPGGLR